MNTGIRVTFDDHGGECQVSISGRITIDSSPDFRAQLLKRLESPSCRSLTADFYEVEYVDTSGLASLVEILKSACSRGKAFHLTRVRARPLYLLEAMRLMHLFDEVNSE